MIVRIFFVVDKEVIYEPIERKRERKDIGGLGLIICFEVI